MARGKRYVSTEAPAVTCSTARRCHRSLLQKTQGCMQKKEHVGPCSVLHNARASSAGACKPLVFRPLTGLPLSLVCTCAGVSEGRDPAVELTQEEPREVQAKHAIEQEKSGYKAAFSQLRGLKGEIEHLQLLLEQSRKKLQTDFQQWLAMVARQQQQQQAQTQQDTGPGAADVDANSSSASAARAGGSRPGTARQYGRSASTRAGTELTTYDESSQQSVDVLRPQSSRGTLRKAVSSVTSSSCLPHSQVLASQPAASTSQSGLDLSKVDPKLLQAAGPHLTGNLEADADIIRFYEAKEKLLQMKLGNRAG